MLQTAQLLPPPWLSTLGFDPARFQTEPPACYRASWQLPGPDSHRQATTSFPSGHDRWTSPPNALGARNFGLEGATADEAAPRAASWIGKLDAVRQQLQRRREVVSGNVDHVRVQRVPVDR